MGCLASAQIYPQTTGPVVTPGNIGDSRMSVISELGVISPEVKVEIRCPLTEKEVIAITRSWKAISRNMTDTGILMFVRMFEGRADVKSMFEQFRSVEGAELSDSRSLENHALLVMNALDESINNLDDPDYLIQMLLTTGRSHLRFENFNKDIFWAIEEPFLASIRDTLGRRLTPELAGLYSKTIRFVLTTLVHGFRTASEVK